MYQLLRESEILWEIWQGRHGSWDQPGGSLWFLDLKFQLVIVCQMCILCLIIVKLKDFFTKNKRYSHSKLLVNLLQLNQIHWIQQHSDSPFSCFMHSFSPLSISWLNLKSCGCLARKWGCLAALHDRAGSVLSNTWAAVNRRLTRMFILGFIFRHRTRLTGRMIGTVSFDLPTRWRWADTGHNYGCVRGKYGCHRGN